MVLLNQDTHQTSIKILLRELVECNLCKSTWESPLDLSASQSTICHHLKKKNRKVSKLGTWVLHTLSEKNKENHLSIATSFLSKPRNELFFKNIIVGDEKLMFYDNVQSKRQWIDEDETLQPTPKMKLHERKVMLCVWWDHCSIIHFEFLNCNQALNADLYFQQVHENPKKMPCTYY